MNRIWDRLMSHPLAGVPVWVLFCSIPAAAFAVVIARTHAIEAFFLWPFVGVGAMVIAVLGGFWCGRACSDHFGPSWGWIGALATILASLAATWAIFGMSSL